MNKSFIFLHLFSRLKTKEKGEQSTNNSHHLSSSPALGLFSTRRDGTIVCPHLGLVLYDCFVPRPLCIHILSVLSFHILICPSVIISLCNSQDCNNNQDLVVLVGNNPLSNSTVLPQSSLHSVQHPHDKRPGATLTGPDPSPTCWGWDLSSAGSSGPRSPHFHFVS